jgi:hypothetical protein
MADANPIDANKLVQTIADEIKHEFEFIEVQGQTLWYSRFYGGGAYSGCCTIHVNEATLTIDGYEANDRPKLLRKFDLADPNSFEQIGEFLRILFDREQPERRVYKSRLPMARPGVTEYSSGPNQATIDAIRSLK